MSDTLPAASAATCRRSSFDDFLYASIREEANGAPLSVLSALARLGLDPWKEAASLAQLSRERAAQKLMSLIETLPHALSTDPVAEAVVPRLIALLPRQTGAAIPSYQTLRGRVSTNQHVVQCGLLYLAFLAMMLLGQWFFVDHAARARGDEVATVAPSSTPPPSQSPILGR
jgi:hypothetical protein